MRELFAKSIKNVGQLKQSEAPCYQSIFI